VAAVTEPLPALPPTFTATRDALHALAEQVVSAARYHATGRIGLRATPHGFGTPAFGDGEVVRVDGTELVHERAGTVRRAPITTLADAAAFVGVPLGAPPVYTAATHADPNAPLGIDQEAAAALANWCARATDLIEAVRAERTDQDSTAPQLWPEHFDLGAEIGDEHAGTRANFGASPGDDTISTPYLYVGPWDEHRRRGVFERYPFGAAASYEELRAAPDPATAGRDFFAACAHSLFDEPG